MPIYEYECPKCGKFEVIQGANAKPLKADPECSRKDCPKSAQRLISQSAFHLKGGGWYKTDYGSSGSAGTGKSASPAATSDSSSASSDSSSTAGSSSDEGGSGKKKKGKPEPSSGGSCGSGCACH